MITARSVVVATILIATISFVALCIRMVGPPDSDGFAGDTYGTHGHGFRGLYEVLGELKMPADRSLVPPGSTLDTGSTLVFLAPSEQLVAIEPSYLLNVAEWVTQGGRVVVVPENVRQDRGQMTFMASEEVPKSVLSVLGLPRVTVASPVDEEDSEEDIHTISGLSNDAAENVTDRLRDLVEQEVTNFETVTVEGEQDYQQLAETVRSLAIPESGLQTIDAGLDDAETILYVIDDAGERHAVAASFSKGQGEIVVVSDSAIWQNRALARDGNAVLALNLLQEPGRTIVFDEFYHGLSIRGNPFWLLTRRSYRLLAIVLFIACGIATWRGAVFLGPPLAEKLTRRRAIGEYVDAMARLFRRGRESNRFVLREVRDGALWKLRCDLRLSPGQEEMDTIASALARREPQRAEKFIATIQQLDRSLSSSRTIRDRDTTRLIREVSDCL